MGEAWSDERPLTTAVFVTDIVKIERIAGGACVKFILAHETSSGLVVEAPPLIIPMQLLPSIVAQIKAWIDMQKWTRMQIASDGIKLMLS